MSRTDLEQQAMLATLGPLGDYVVKVGMEKGLAHYSKEEILGLVETVLNTYHHVLQTYYQDDIPF